MCSNYEAITDEQKMLTHFGVGYPSEREAIADAERQKVKAHTWPTDFAPFIRLHEDGSGNKVIEHGRFGLLPGFAKEVAYGRRTYNARSETVHRLPSFRESWAKGWRCIVPVEAVHEPNYESGKSVWYRIRRADGQPMGIAGIYRKWSAPGGAVEFTFAMLTINADGHPTFARMHKPHDEKRMVVILEKDAYDTWLTCSVEKAPRFFKQSTAIYEAEPADKKHYRGPQQAL
jgi:putative SOS response-associated peptidase YedK